MTADKFEHHPQIYLIQVWYLMKMNREPLNLGHLSLPSKHCIGEP